jgi:hypothetical protein
MTQDDRFFPAVRRCIAECLNDPAMTPDRFARNLVDIEGWSESDAAAVAEFSANKLPRIKSLLDT